MAVSKNLAWLDASCSVGKKFWRVSQKSRLLARAFIVTEDQTERVAELIKACLCSASGVIYTDNGVREMYQSVSPRKKKGVVPSDPKEVEAKREEQFVLDCTAAFGRRRLMGRLFNGYDQHLPNLKLLKSQSGKVIGLQALHLPFQEEFWRKEPTLRRMAKCVRDATCASGEPVIPRDQRQSLFLGFGTTVHALVREILRDHTDFKCSIYTTSFEAAVAFSRMQLKPFLEGTPRVANFHLTSKCRVDFKQGCVLPPLATGELGIGAAVVSFDLIDSRGVMASKVNEVAEVTNAVLKESRRIVIMADQDKYTSTANLSGVIRLPADPPPDGAYLVTNSDRIRQAYRCLPEWVTYINVADENLPAVWPTPGPSSPSSQAGTSN